MSPMRSLRALLLPLCLVACSMPEAPSPERDMAARLAHARFALDAGSEPLPEPGVTARVSLASAARLLNAPAPHRWTVSDVYEYVATLSMRRPDQTFSAVSGAAPVVLPQKGGSAQSVASFPGLVRGNVYRVDVVAKGNPGGTAATTVMNAVTPTQVTLDLTQGAIATTISAQATVVLDPLQADPGGEFHLTPPSADGQFAAPSASPTIEPATYRVEMP